MKYSDFSKTYHNGFDIYLYTYIILRLVLILKENISVAEDFHLAYETLATTVNLDTDIDLWSNDMSNMKHANIGTR